MMPAAPELIVGVIVGGVLLLLYILYKFLYAPYQLLGRCGIKCPPHTPFLGHYRDRVKMNAMEHDQILYEKYGPISGFYIGQQANILVADLDILKQIMVKDFDNFSDHIPLPNFVNDGSEPKDLVSSKGETWRTVRRTLSPSFSASKMKLMLPLIMKSTDSLVEVIGEKVTTGKGFNIHKVYGSFTLEAILATAFGRQVNIQKGESDEFSEAVDTILNAFIDGQLEQFILLNSNFPWVMSLIDRVFSYSEYGRAIGYIKKVTMEIISTRRQLGSSEKHKDILQLMIDASSEEGDSDETKETEAPPAECPAHKTVTTVKRQIMSDAEVVENSFVFLFAGNETTATTLAFASYALALHPDIQEKLQSEIVDYFEEKPEANLYVAAQEIAYLDNVVQETLRLYPPAPETDRICTKTTTINGVTFPKGVAIAIPIGLLQRSPLYWKDPEKFDPDRFTAEERAKRPQLCYMPFGFGPRVCIGMRLALLETKIALIELLKKYTFVRAPETEVPIKLGVGVITRPKNGIYLKVVNRS